MPWYPEALRREVTRFRSPMTTGPVRVNLHTAVSNAASLYPFFSQTGRPCSHFYVRANGIVEQYVDTRYRAAADLEGNLDTISVESWDGYGAGAWKNGAVPPWTAAQLAGLARLLAWVLTVHPTIPARIATDSRPGPTSHGISWHRLGIDPWRKPDGLRYSNARGKVCPGDARIAQIPGLLARAAQIRDGDDMPLTDDDVERIARRTADLIANREVAPRESKTSRAFWDAAWRASTVPDALPGALASALATVPGVDAAQIETAVRDGLEKALAGRLEVSVSVRPEVSR